MFDIGFWELSLIGIVALLVFGPQRLPELARSVGQWVARARQMVWSVRNEVERELDLAELRKLNQRIDVPRLEDWLDDSNAARNPRTAAANRARQSAVTEPAAEAASGSAVPGPGGGGAAGEHTVGADPGADPDPVPDPGGPRSGTGQV